MNQRRFRPKTLFQIMFWHQASDFIGLSQQQRREKAHDSWLNSYMKIAEVVSDIDRQRLQNLKRNSANASKQLKQERFRQAMLRYDERMKKRKPDSPEPKRPEQPKPLQVPEV